MWGGGERLNIFKLESVCPEQEKEGVAGKKVDGFQAKGPVWGIAVLTKAGSFRRGIPE